MNRSNFKVYAAALHSAALSHKSALQFELAVGFAVMLEAGPSKRVARALLCEIYASAGCKCNDPQGLDWKSVNRRITASLLLYDFVTEAEVRVWAAGLSKSALINAIVEKLAVYKLSSVNEVLQICNTTRTQPLVKRGPKPGYHIDTANLHIIVPSSATSEELLEAASKLMALASRMVEDKTHTVRKPASKTSVAVQTVSA
jgi:hypothetical protein